jgi:hypothetical protein
MTKVRIDFPYLKEDTDRHGNVRIYVRRNGCKIRIRAPKGSPEFARAYAEAIQTLDHPGGAKAGRGIEPAPAGTLGWLAASYFASARFKKLDPKSQATRRLVIEHCLREPRKLGAANNRKKYLSAMFGWAVRQHHMKSNPARDAGTMGFSDAVMRL